MISSTEKSKADAFYTFPEDDIFSTNCSTFTHAKIDNMRTSENRDRITPAVLAHKAVLEHNDDVIMIDDEKCSSTTDMCYEGSPVEKSVIDEVVVVEEHAVKLHTTVTPTATESCSDVLHIEQTPTEQSAANKSVKAPMFKEGVLEQSIAVKDLPPEETPIEKLTAKKATKRKSKRRTSRNSKKVLAKNTTLEEMSNSNELIISDCATQDANIEEANTFGQDGQMSTVGDPTTEEYTLEDRIATITVGNPTIEDMDIAELNIQEPKIKGLDCEEQTFEYRVNEDPTAKELNIQEPITGCHPVGDSVVEHPVVKTCTVTKLPVEDSVAEPVVEELSMENKKTVEENTDKETIFKKMTVEALPDEEHTDKEATFEDMTFEDHIKDVSVENLPVKESSVEDPAIDELTIKEPVLSMTDEAASLEDGIAIDQNAEVSKRSIVKETARTPAIEKSALEEISLKESTVEQSVNQLSSEVRTSKMLSAELSAVDVLQREKKQEDEKTTKWKSNRRKARNSTYAKKTLPEKSPVKELADEPPTLDDHIALDQNELSNLSIGKEPSNEPTIEESSLEETQVEKTTKRKSNRRSRSSTKSYTKNILPEKLPVKDLSDETPTLDEPIAEHQNSEVSNLPEIMVNEPGNELKTEKPALEETNQCVNQLTAESRIVNMVTIDRRTVDALSKEAVDLQVEKATTRKSNRKRLRASSNPCTKNVLPEKCTVKDLIDESSTPEEPIVVDKNFDEKEQASEPTTEEPTLEERTVEKQVAVQLIIKDQRLETLTNEEPDIDMLRVEEKELQVEKTTKRKSKRRKSKISTKLHTKNILPEKKTVIDEDQTLEKRIAVDQIAKVSNLIESNNPEPASEPTNEELKLDESIFEKHIVDQSTAECQTDDELLNSDVERSTSDVLLIEEKVEKRKPYTKYMVPEKSSVNKDLTDETTILEESIVIDQNSEAAEKHSMDQLTAESQTVNTLIVERPVEALLMEESESQVKTKRKSNRRKSRNSKKVHMKNTLPEMSAVKKTIDKEITMDGPAVVEISTVEERTIDGHAIKKLAIKGSTIEELTFEGPTAQVTIGYATAQPTVKDPAVELMIGDQSAVELAIEHSGVKEPTIDDPTVEEPTVKETTIDDPTVEEPTVEAQTIDDPTVEEPTVKEPTIDDPIVEAPTIDNPAVEEPAVEVPTIEDPTDEKRGDGDTVEVAKLVVDASSKSKAKKRKARSITKSPVKSRRTTRSSSRKGMHTAV